MLKWTTKLAPVALLIALAGCSNSSDPVAVAAPPPPPPPPPPPTATVQALHASPDAPAVNVSIGSNSVNDVDYKEGSAEIELNTGRYAVKVDAILPGGTSTVIGPVGPDACVAVPPSAAARMPSAIAPYRPAAAPIPDCTPKASASGRAMTPATNPPDKSPFREGLNNSAAADSAAAGDNSAPDWGDDRCS